MLPQITDFLWVGARSAAQDRGRLQALGITHIVNVTDEVRNYHAAPPASTLTANSASIAAEPPSPFTYLRVPVTDTATASLTGLLPAAVAFIHCAVARHEGVLVHCQLGVSRSAAVVLAYLIQAAGLSLKDAYTHLKLRRAVAKPRPNFLKELMALDAAAAAASAAAYKARVAKSTLTPGNATAPAAATAAAPGATSGAGKTETAAAAAAGAGSAAASTASAASVPATTTATAGGYAPVHVPAEALRSAASLSVPQGSGSSSTYSAHYGFGGGGESGDCEDRDSGPPPYAPRRSLEAFQADLCRSLHKNSLSSSSSSFSHSSRAGSGSSLPGVAPNAESHLAVGSCRGAVETENAAVPTKSSAVVRPLRGVTCEDVTDCVADATNADSHTEGTRRSAVAAADSTTTVSPVRSSEPVNNNNNNSRGSNGKVTVGRVTLCGRPKRRLPSAADSDCDGIDDDDDDDDDDSQCGDGNGNRSARGTVTVELLPAGSDDSSTSSSNKSDGNVSHPHVTEAHARLTAALSEASLDEVITSPKSVVASKSTN